MNDEQCTCKDCKFANEYIAWWWYPHYTPTCLKGHPLSENKIACLDFQLIGRLSR